MSIFGSDPDNPVSGDMPADKLEGSDTVVGLSDQGDSVADSADAAADGLTDEGGELGATAAGSGASASVASEAVRDPAPAVDPADGSDDGSVNDIGGVGSTSATLPEDD